MAIPMPQPAIDNWNRPFWDACAEGILSVQRCRDTGKTWFPPAPVSPFSPKGEWEWIRCSGGAEVLSWVVFHQKYFAGFGDRLPYNVAVVKLDEGALMCTNIDAPNETIQIGQRVQVAFEQRGEVNVPVFKPVKG